MTSHMIDRDRIHTFCGLRVSTLGFLETVPRQPTCEECQNVARDGLYVRNHLQTWWESQLKTKGMPS